MSVRCSIVRALRPRARALCRQYRLAARRHYAMRALVDGPSVCSPRPRRDLRGCAVDSGRALRDCYVERGGGLHGGQCSLAKWVAGARARPVVGQLSGAHDCGGAPGAEPYAFPCPLDRDALPGARGPARRRTRAFGQRAERRGSRDGRGAGSRGSLARGVRHGPPHGKRGSPALSPYVCSPGTYGFSSAADSHSTSEIQGPGSSTTPRSTPSSSASCSVRSSGTPRSFFRRCWTSRFPIIPCFTSTSPFCTGPSYCGWLGTLPTCASLRA